MRSWVLHYVFFFLLLSIACTSKSGQDRSSGDSLSPLDSLNQLIVETPNDPELYVLRAKKFEELSRIDDALSDIDRSLGFDSLDADTHGMKGRLLFKRGEIGPSLNALRQALEIQPENTTALLVMAEVRFVLKEYDPSMKLVNEALRIDEQLKKGYFIKGLIYKEQRDTSLAISSFQTVTELDPNDAEAFLMLGLLHAGFEDELALDYYESVIGIEPSHIEARYNKAMFLQGAERHEEAISSYREILALDSTYAVAHYNIGFVQLGHLDQVDSAIISFDRAIALSPRYYQAFYNRGYAHELSGDIRQAQKDYLKCLEISPNNELAVQAMNRLN